MARRIKVAPAAQSILNQATFYRRSRSKASDGTVGDAAHRSRPSDHNPDKRGIVHAADLTHDPKRGVDAHAWIRWRVARGDRRIKYAISNRQIWEPGQGWRRYTGENPHTKHAHVSIFPQYENDTSPWFDGWFTTDQTSTPPPYVPVVNTPPPPPTNAAADMLKAIAAAIYLTKVSILEKGPVGVGDKRTEVVKVIQRGLQNTVKATIVDDGGFGEQTKRWVIWLQGVKGLPQTGVVDIFTFNTMFP